MKKHDILNYMKVFYNPSYNGTVFLDTTNQKLLFNTQICNTKGLVDLIELHAGLHIEVKSDIDRMVEYYQAIKKCCSDSTFIFRNSFEVDGINTAKKCLSWRDSLIAAGWNPKKNLVSERMKALAKIEENFTAGSFQEKILQVVHEIENGCTLPENLEIVTPFDYSCFPPFEVRLLNALAERGVVVHEMTALPEGTSFLRKVAGNIVQNKNDILSLKDNDGSLEILEFPDKADSLKYLSRLPSDAYSVWISRDTRTLNSYLQTAGKPLCSSEDRGITQVSALPLIGLCIFQTPLNLTSLVNWLSTPMHPFSAEERHKLIDAIVSTGGYFNDECAAVLALWTDKNKEYISFFLPDITDTDLATVQNLPVNAQIIEEYLAKLSEWLTGCTQSEELAPAKRDSIQSALETCRRMRKILTLNADEEIEYEKMLLLFDTAISDSVTQLSCNEAGCMNYITDGCNFAGVSERTIWCDFYNPEEIKLTYDFLSPSERKELCEGIWTSGNEQRYIRYNKYLPFLLTDSKMTLVTVKKDGTKDIIKEPLLIRIAENTGDDYVKYIISKTINDITGIKTMKPVQINNRFQKSDGTIAFTKKELVDMRPHESYSSISVLIDSPFDYMFQNILKLNKKGTAALSPVFTTKGTVAHAIIENLFNPATGGTPQEIEGKITTSFEYVFHKCIRENGGILLQPDNLSEVDSFKNKMKLCVQKLCSFIKENELKVISCEQKHENIELPEFKKQKIVFNGSIDMVLEDKNKNPVLFDFKYSPKTDTYKKYLEDNRSMQFAVYKGFMRVHENNPQLSLRIAYVLLPDVKVITVDDFKGNTIKVQPKNSDNILLQMSHSYDFRVGQFKKGVVEDGEGIDADMLEYVKETDNKNMLPLEIEKHSRSVIKKNKKPNGYSNYLFFKAGY